MERNGERDGSGMEVSMSMKGGRQGEMAATVTRLLTSERMTCSDVVYLSTDKAYRVKHCDVLFDVIVLYKLINC